MTVDHWNVMCETGSCKWRKFRLATKDAAIQAGDAHVEDRHPHVDRYRFRVQDIAASVDVFEAAATSRMRR